MVKRVSEIMSEMADKLGKSTMTEDEKQSAAPVDEDYDWYSSELRRHSAEEIQRAFSKTLAELTGKKYQAQIMCIDFAPKWAGGSAGMSDYAEIQLRISPPRWKFSENEDKGAS